MKSVAVFVVVACCLAGVAFAKSACEEHRERELKAKTNVRLVPKCNANGDYEALQCFDGSSFCMCWRPDGSHVAEPSMKIKTCECHMHRDREMQKSQNGFVGNFVPSCEVSGYYSAKQCHGSTGFCWCGDKHGNKLAESVRGELNC